MRRNYFLFLFFTVIVINTSPIGTLMLLSQNITEIMVKDQNDFDGLNKQLIETINGIQSNIEHQVLVKFQSNSTFLFNDKNKIYFNNIEKPNVELVFTTTSGEQDVNIISDGIKYVRPSDYSSYLNDEGSHFYKKLKTRHSKRETYLNQDLKIVPLMNSGSLSDIGMNVATTKIFEVDSTTAKMGISDDLKERLSNIGETDLKNCLLYLESWFRIHQLQIKKLEGNTLFFYYDQDPYDKSFEHVINGDFYYSGQLPQFYITNIGQKSDNTVYIELDHIYIPVDIEELYECKYDNLIEMNSVNLKKIEILNLIFSGSAYASTKDDDIDKNFFVRRSLLNFYNTNNIHIHHNYFRNTGNERVIRIYGDPINYEESRSKSVIIEDNVVTNLYGFFVETWYICDVLIQNNISLNTGIFYKFGGVIECVGNRFFIKNNIFTNFSYAGIRVGGEYLSRFRNTGIIEENLIYNTPEYISNYHGNTIMDGGGIYIWTHNDSTICRNNIIHNIKGRKDYRGIFCDDSAYNTILEGNLIFNIDGFTIGSQYHSSKEGNYSNVVKNNILIGGYLLQGNPNLPDKMSIKEHNLVGGKSTVIFSHILEKKADIIDPLARHEHNRVILYHDTTGLNIHPFVAERLIICDNFNLNSRLRFKVSDNFIRLDSNKFIASELYCPDQKDSLRELTNNQYKWTKSYRLDEEINLESNERLKIIDVKFAIVGKPDKEDDLHMSKEVCSFSHNQDTISFHSLNPIKKGIDEGRFILDGDIFRTEYMSPQEFSSIIFEALNTTQISVVAKVNYIDEEDEKNLLTATLTIPIEEIRSGGLQKVYVKSDDYQPGFVLSDYWNLETVELNTESSDFYKASSIIMLPGTVAKNGFVAVASIINDEEVMPNDIHLNREDDHIHKAPSIIMKDGFIGKDGFIAMSKNKRKDMAFNEFADCEVEYFSYPRAEKDDKNHLEVPKSEIHRNASEAAKILYPNPFNKILNVRNLGTNRQCYIQIHDTSGHLIFQKHCLKEGDQIIFPSTVKGVYIASIVTEREVHIEKLLLQ